MGGEGLVEDGDWWSFFVVPAFQYALYQETTSPARLEHEISESWTSDKRRNQARLPPLESD